MIILQSFGIYIIAILVSSFIMHHISIRFEQRIGLTEKPFLLFFKDFPGFLKTFPAIIILFISYYISITEPTSELKTKAFIFLLILITIFPLNIKNYGIPAIKTSALISIIITLFTASSFSNIEYQYPFIHNPFTLFSLIIGILVVPILNKNDKETQILNITRNFTLNVFLISLFVIQQNFIIISAISVLIICIQNITKYITPKLNIFQKMQFSLSLTLSCSLLCFIGNLLWLILLNKNSIFYIFRI
jgi:hypothetical protein